MTEATATILKMPTTTKLVCSECGAPGEGSCRCGAPYVKPGERAEAYVKAHPEMTDRSIAEKIGSNPMTVGRARKKSGVTNVTTEKRTGKDGKKYKAHKPRARKPHYKEADIIALLDKGFKYNEIAKQTEVGERAIRDIIERELARRDAVAKTMNSLHVNPETLAPSAKAKLEIAKRQIQHSFEAQFAERMHKIDEEVRQRVLKEGKEYLAKLEAMEEKASENERFYREMTNHHKSIFTIDQFNLIRKCLHQNGIAATPRDFDAAFDLIQKKKLQLTGQK